MATMPTLLSLRVKKAAMNKIRIVTGMAAIVNANSTVRLSTTMTTN